MNETVWRLYADHYDSKDLIAEWAEKPSEQDVGLAINRWAEERNWKTPYCRIWTDEEGATWYDVGSWSTLLILKEETK